MTASDVHMVADRRSSVSQQPGRIDGQNRNPNTQIASGAAKDLRGRMKAALHNSAAGGVADILTRGQDRLTLNQPVLNPRTSPDLGRRGTVEPPPPMVSSPLRPYSCLFLFAAYLVPTEKAPSLKAIEGMQQDSSNSSLGDDDFLKECPEVAENFACSDGAVPSPIRGFDGSCTLIEQVDSADWGQLGEPYTVANDISAKNSSSAVPPFLLKHVGKGLHPTPSQLRQQKQQPQRRQQSSPSCSDKFPIITVDGLLLSKETDHTAAKLFAHDNRLPGANTKGLHPRMIHNAAVSRRICFCCIVAFKDQNSTFACFLSCIS